MGDGNIGGIYDDINSDWIIQWDENSAVRLYHNASEKLATTSTGVSVTGNVSASGGNSTEWNTAYDNSITALAFSGGSTTTLTLTQQDGGEVSNTFSNPQGTVVGATSGNTNTITVSASNTSPIVTAVTAAVSSGSSALATGAQIQTAINTALLGVLSYQGTWNASTNSPTLASGTGTPGYYYIVSVAGSTNLDGITDWAVGDWAVFSDLATDAWQKIDNTQVGNVTGSGANQRLAFWNSTSNITSDDELTWDGVNLNIGTYAGTGDCELRLFGSTPNNSFSTLKTTNGNLHIDPDSGHGTFLNYYLGTAVYIGTGAGGYSGTQFNANGNATVGADLTVSGGDIILSGTGRIQGVDTVSVSTDAANKLYVDNAVAGVPQGTVTGSGTVNTLPKFTGTGASIGNSSISDTGSVVTFTNGTINFTNTGSHYWNLFGNLNLLGTTDLGQDLNLGSTTARLKSIVSNAGTYQWKNLTTDLAQLSSTGALRLYNYGAGTLVSDASGNITVSSGGGAGGPYLPLAGGTLTGGLIGTSAGFTQGVYDNVNGLRLLNPGGGSSTGQTSSQSGAIKVTLPVSWTNTMMRMTIKVYEYTTNESFTIVCGGYNYSSSTTWINHFAYIESSAKNDRNFNVRFGHDGTKCCVYIGELASTWSYPQVFVTEFEAGYSNTSASTWRTGWVVGFETSAFGTITQTETNTQVNNWARNGQNTYLSSGSGNVGIGVTSPSAKLVVQGAAGNLYIDDLGAGYNYYDASNVHNFRNTAGISRLYINTSTGNVGINETSPSQKLHVAGNVRVTGAYYDSGDSPGSTGEYLKSTITGTTWASIPAYKFYLLADSPGTSVSIADSTVLDIAGGTNISTVRTGAGSSGDPYVVTANLDNDIAINTVEYTYPTAINQYRGEIVYFGTFPTASGSNGQIAPGDVIVYTSAGLSAGWMRAQGSIPYGKGMLGIAMGTTPAAGILVKGFARNAAFTSGGLGSVLYLSPTSAGDTTLTIPSASNNIVRIVGYMLNPTNDEIFFDPDKSWVQIV